MASRPTVAMETDDIDGGGNGGNGGSGSAEVGRSTILASASLRGAPRAPLQPLLQRGAHHDPAGGAGK